MRKKIHLKRKNKIKKNLKLKILIIFIPIIVFLVIDNINKKISPILYETAELEIGKFSTIVINKAISQVLEDKINANELFNTIKNNNGEIQTIDFNPIIVNQILNIATTVVQNNLKLLEEGNLDNIGIYDMDLPEKRLRNLEKGIIITVPSGIIFKNSILSNLGPGIPIRMHYIGDVNSNISTKITQYGINNAMVEISVKLSITAQIILPFTTKKITLESNIPIAIKMIQGNIPNYYGNSLVGETLPYSIPMQ